MKEFKESPNTAVFTTKYVLEDKKTITYVSHDEEDGAWQFFSDDKFDNYEEVAKVLALQEIIEMDSSLLELAEMPYGYYATRKHKDEEWKIFKHK